MSAFHAPREQAGRPSAAEIQAPTQDAHARDAEQIRTHGGKKRGKKGGKGAVASSTHVNSKNTNAKPHKSKQGKSKKAKQPSESLLSSKKASTTKLKNKGKMEARRPFRSSAPSLSLLIGAVALASALVIMLAKSGRRSGIDDGIHDEKLPILLARPREPLMALN